MNIEPESAELRLPRGAFLRVQDGRDLVVALREGFLWITRPGWGRDVLLGGGQSYRIDADGLVLVQATQPSRLALLSGSLQRRIAFEAHGDGAVVQALSPRGLLARLRDRFARLGILDYGNSTWDMHE